MICFREKFGFVNGGMIDPKGYVSLGRIRHMFLDRDDYDDVWSERLFYLMRIYDRRCDRWNVRFYRVDGCSEIFGVCQEWE